jgi:hypothetical protein
LSRRVRLPAADDLFRPTVVPAPREPESGTPSADGDRAAAAASADELSGPRGSRAPSRRVRHDEKMTVYVTADELLDLEDARLTLRRAGLSVDRGRLVREAIAIALADLDANGDDSVIMHRLMHG